MEASSGEPEPSEPSLQWQVLEFVGAPLVFGGRKSVASWLKDSSPFYLEGIQRDSPPGVNFSKLSHAAAYDLGATSLLVGVQHLVGLLLCLPEVTRKISKSWSANLICHASLLGAGAGLAHLAWALFRLKDAESGSKNLPLSVVVFIAGLHVMSIITCIPMNLHYSTEYAYVLMVFGFHLSGFAANLLSPLAWTFDDSYLPSLPILWLISGFDTIIAVVVRGPVLLWSIVMLKRLWYIDGAWLILLAGTLGTITTIPATTLLLIGSLSKFRYLINRAQIKDD
ncbi:unnamed protein product [Durusdinium trenchii]|uniref:Uncharacterized protein n=1 Tax=Durusdinium trenchii TaxID=1381693 RepID=A0ABP0KXS1_9DINO